MSIEIKMPLFETSPKDGSEFFALFRVFDEEGNFAKAWQMVNCEWNVEGDHLNIVEPEWETIPDKILWNGGLPDPVHWIDKKEYRRQCELEKLEE